MTPRPQIPEGVEEYRDERWRREGTRQVESALDAERFIEEVGFAACLTDSRLPSAVFYQPKFTYIWTLGVGRFPDALRRRVRREVALREIARCFLAGAGLTIPGELARVTGLSRPEAGLANRALVAEGRATMLAPGMYQLVEGLAPQSALL